MGMAREVEEVREGSGAAERGRRRNGVAAALRNFFLLNFFFLRQCYSVNGS